MYEDAAAAGFVAAVLWGGEPMVRTDTGEVLKVAHGAGMNTTLITNGWFLDDRGDEVYPWLDRLLVSVDGLDERQDEIRRCPGLFQRLDRGLVRARRDHPDVRVIILTVISKLNVDQLEGIALYGKEHGAQVIFQAMNFTDYGFAGRVLDEEKIRLSAGEEREVAERIDRLRRDGFPVRDSNAYLSRLGNAWNDYTCHYKKAVLRVEPNGDVLDCTAVAAPMVNVRTTSLRELIGSPAFRDFVGRAESCNRCRDAGVIEASHIWEGRIGAIWNAVRSL
jgi:MoaA/NifB/PqqE/SkfB family radical SAM enzyme